MLGFQGRFSLSEACMRRGKSKLACFQGRFSPPGARKRRGKSKLACFQGRFSLSKACKRRRKSKLAWFPGPIWNPWSQKAAGEIKACLFSRAETAPHPHKLAAKTIKRRGKPGSGGGNQQKGGCSQSEAASQMRYYKLLTVIIFSPDLRTVTGTVRSRRRAGPGVRSGCPLR